jgi:phosphoglycerate dehydrogenase-like enzyme
MLAVTRRIPAMDRDVRAGQWPRGLLTQLEGRTLGLIGLGAIGSRVATLARPFGMRMLASTFGPDKGRAGALGAQHVPVEQLLRESDIVSLHLRLSADTQGYLGKERLAMMKPTAFLINTARGGLVDKQALIDALREKRLAGAALDVFHEEPIPPGDPLLTLPELVLTPHNGGMTREVIDNGVLRAVENIQLFLGGRPRDVVVAPPGR